MAKREKEPLLVYIDELVETLRATAPDAIKSGDAKAVHQARVTTRRLKAAADVFQPISAGSHRKEFTRILKKLRRSLGPMRDLSVMLGHLGEMEAKRYKPGIEWITGQLTQQQASAKESARDLDPAKALSRLGAWWGVREEWSQAGHEGLGTRLAESVHLQLDCFIEHADAIAGQSIADAGLAMGDAHALRIAGKSLRYTLELAVAGGHRLPAAIARAFKRMQDALGLWHDFVVLNRQVLELLVAQHDAPVMLSSLGVCMDAVKRSRKQLETFARLWKDGGKAISTTIREAFPLTKPVEETAISEPQKDPGPSDLSAPPADQAEHSPGETSAA